MRETYQQYEEYIEVNQKRTKRFTYLQERLKALDKEIGENLQQYSDGLENLKRFDKTLEKPIEMLQKCDMKDLK